MLCKGKRAKIPFNQSRLTHHLLNAGSQTMIIPHITPSIIPKQIYIFQVNYLSFNSTLKTNPNYFPHNNIGSVNFKVDGTDVLAERYNLNFTTGDVLPVY